MKLRDELLEFINAQVSLDASVPIAAETDLLLTGLVDSLGVIEIVGWLQDKTGVGIDPIEVVIDNFQTADRMVALVERLLSEQDR